MPTRDKRVPAAKLSAGTIAPGTTRETTPAVRQPTATDSSQKPRANIAEGCGRSSRRDFARFLHVAQGSASELEYHWILALDLGLVDQTGYEQITAGVTDVKRMLTGLVRRLERTARAAR